MVKRPGKRNNGPVDWHLWRDVTGSVNPLRRKSTSHKATTPTKFGVAPGPDQIKFSNTEILKPSTPPRRYYSPPWSPGMDYPGREMGGKTASSTQLDPRIHRRVRRGQLPIDAEVDLHGLRQEEAHGVLRRFILARVANGDRTVLVITGKGLKKTGFGALAERGVLRHMLPRWLSEADIKPYVSGWEVSARHHGGEGAFYVRLKRMSP